MDKAQAIHNFWSSFGLTAYDENSVPDDALTPYITYSVVEDNFDSPVMLSASIWYRSTSWAEIETKSQEISKAINDMYPSAIKIDNGRLYITRGTPFAQRMNDPSDDMIKRIYINIYAEYLTAY